MSIFSPIRHWFQKRFPALDSATAAMEQQGRFNALYGADPDKIVSAITSFKCGTLAPLARIIEDYEDRDDKMKICAVKLRASAARCDYSIMIREGFEDDPKAKRHAEILKRFWSSISVSSAFNRNEKGSIRLLKKQMMYAQSYGFSVHEIVWQPLPGGELAATFIHVPLWHFENHSGELRFLKSTNQYDGVSMAPGEWLVTSGDAIGTAAVICACAKHMSFQDWLLFSERCGIPMVHAKTDAPYKSDTWNNLAAAVRRLGRDFRILTDNNTSITPVSFANSGNLPYPPLVEWADRAIAALYRGADLSTISAADGTGASLQGDESSMMEQDSCEMLSETLNEQVGKFVIRYVTGDDRPLAYISIAPVTKPDVSKDIAIDNHLIAHGCRLSKRDMCQRYGRTETTDDADAAQAAPEAPQGLANESTKKTDRPASPAQDPAQILARIAATILDGSVPFDKALTKASQELEMAGISSFSGDLEKALAEAMFTAAASSLSKSSAPAAPSAGMANAGTSEGARKGWITRRNGWTAEQAAEYKQKVSDLSKRALSDPTFNDGVNLGPVSGVAVDDIKKAVGVDVTGFKQEINPQDIRHAHRHHGPAHLDRKGRQRGEFRDNQIPLEQKDYDRITEVFSDYDEIVPGSPEWNTGMKTIRYRKTFEDGTLVCVDVVAEKNKTLRFKDAWKEKLSLDR